MTNQPEKFDRRGFIKKSSHLALGTGGLFTSSSLIASGAAHGQDSPFFIGPVEGFTPQIGTLVSILNYMTLVVTGSINNMSTEDLDYLVEPGANTIGGLISHAIATEKWCQVRTFGWDRSEIMNSTDRQAEDLGDDARSNIKGNDFKFYQNEFKKVRENTLSELAKRDDNWLMEVDENHYWGAPVNNYCQWFHVIEHEAQHVGQIMILRKKLPSAKKND
ncbi:DUF664 domain-containing protein [Fulvivirgaceae bacterium BMA12]|uniref:DUF664 domain-containing protein n=1 Tax=Agaribacillus aureus TaxID=3051825 RepID=A0ABT8L4X4_9BACT|nr:DUF664 domain-containing protein [Fulvivirgaceae bacterium BMA12]